MQYQDILDLFEVIRQLRDPKTGCPWDIQQTHDSLTKFLVEESYEYIDAVKEGDLKKMEEELGDVFLQILLHAQIASEQGHFDINSVARELAKKLVYRHPHVFKNGLGTSISSDEVLKKWEELKKTEKKRKYEIDKNLLIFPSLLTAYKIGKKAEKLNFDWKGDTNAVILQCEEEWKEFKEELNKPQKEEAKIKEELGDFLFSIAQLARHLKFEPEDLLREANKKFINRFNLMEDKISEDKKDFKTMTNEELEEYWLYAKERAKQGL